MTVQNVHNEGVEISTDAEIMWVSQLLELPETGVKEAFTMKVTVSRPRSHTQTAPSAFNYTLCVNN